jgi:hypothetical protein
LRAVILNVRSIPLIVRFLLPLTCMLCICGRLYAQLPFYTDDTAVTERGKWHFEFFDEYDALQLQYPNLKQNTANFKLNYGLPHNLEVDMDSPYLSTDRQETSPPTAWGTPTWALRQTFARNPRTPALLL